MNTFLFAKIGLAVVLTAGLASPAAALAQDSPAPAHAVVSSGSGSAGVITVR